MIEFFIILQINLEAIQKNIARTNSLKTRYFKEFKTRNQIKNKRWRD